MEKSNKSNEKKQNEKPEKKMIGDKTGTRSDKMIGGTEKKSESKIL